MKKTANRTQIQVTAVEINKDAIIIEGLNIDKLILIEDLYKDVAEEPIVRYEFRRDTENGAPLKYLWKVVSSIRFLNSFTSFGAKVENLIGQYVIFADSFKAAA